MSITVSTLQIYVSTGALKIWSALPVPIIFIPIIDEVNTFAENLLRKTNLKMIIFGRRWLCFNYHFTGLQLRYIMRY